MKTRRWMLLLLIMIVSTMSMAIHTGVTNGLFTDGEASTGNDLNISWSLPPQTLLSDGFEGTYPWGTPLPWGGNGATSWTQDTRTSYGGSASATSDKSSNGFLTSDDLDATSATSITVSFWYYKTSIEFGDLVVKYRNGAWNTLPDITDDLGCANKTWCSYSEVISDASNFDFKVQFDTTLLIQGGESINIDDVLIEANY